MIKLLLIFSLLFFGIESHYIVKRYAGLCENVNCLNGGSCIPYGERSYCECAPDFWGSICQFSPACNNVDCQNGIF